MIVKSTFELPFKIPIENHEQFAGSYGFADFAVEFDHIEREIDVIGSITKVKRTILHISYSPKTKLQYVEDIETVARIFIYDSLFYINKIIRAVKRRFSIMYIHEITVYDLLTTIYVEVDGTEAAYITNIEFLVDNDRAFTSEEKREVLNTITTEEIYPQYFLAENYLESGRTQMYLENFSRAVIDFQTSFEVYMRNALFIILKHKNFDEERIEKLTSTPFRNLIEQHLSKHLKTSLKYNDNGPINEWYEKLYKVRNRIVHQGDIYVRKIEATEAHDAYVCARNHVADLLDENGYLLEGANINLKHFNEYQLNELEANKAFEKMRQKGLIKSE